MAIVGRGNEAKKKELDAKVARLKAAREKVWDPFTRDKAKLAASRAATNAYLAAIRERGKLNEKPKKRK